MKLLIVEQSGSQEMFAKVATEEDKHPLSATFTSLLRQAETKEIVFTKNTTAPAVLNNLQSTDDFDIVIVDGIRNAEFAKNVVAHIRHTNDNSKIFFVDNREFGTEALEFGFEGDLDEIGVDCYINENHGIPYVGRTFFDAAEIEFEPVLRESSYNDISMGSITFSVESRAIIKETDTPKEPRDLEIVDFDFDPHEKAKRIDLTDEEALFIDALWTLKGKFCDRMEIIRTMFDDAFPPYEIYPDNFDLEETVRKIHTKLGSAGVSNPKNYIAGNNRYGFAINEEIEELDLEQTLLEISIKPELTRTAELVTKFNSEGLRNVEGIAFDANGFHFDGADQRLYLEGSDEPIKLAHKETVFLEIMSPFTEPLSKGAILNAMFEYSQDTKPYTVLDNIARGLRQKIKDKFQTNPDQLFRTVRGRGYQLLRTDGLELNRSLDKN